MGIRIVQTARTPDYDLHGVKLDLTRKTGVLIRQSKKGAEVESPESRLRQESLVPVAVALRGDADKSDIILYDEGSGVSGTKGHITVPRKALQSGTIFHLLAVEGRRWYRAGSQRTSVLQERHGGDTRRSALELRSPSAR